MDVLNITHLTKRFGDKEVLKGIDLCVKSGSIYGFIGQNGAGKTTTMKAVLGLLASDGGEITVCGEKVTFGETKTNRYVGYLPDVPEFYSFMTAREYLRLCGESLGMDREDIISRSEELLELVGLANEKHRIKGYSRGMKQRLGIAQALLGRPKLLICDEPTSALDPVGRKEILDILLSVKDQTTVLFSTHILTDVERICTDVAFLHNGKIAMQGTVAELKKLHHSNEFAVTLVNSEDVNRVCSAYSNARLNAQGSIVFAGDDELMFDFLAYLAKEKISVSEIHRIEPTLENLFLEVVG